MRAHTRQGRGPAVARSLATLVEAKGLQLEVSQVARSLGPQRVVSSAIGRVRDALTCHHIRRGVSGVSASSQHDWSASTIVHVTYATNP